MSTRGSRASKGPRQWSFSTSQNRSKERLLVKALLGTGIGSIVCGSMSYLSDLRLREQEFFRPAYFDAVALSIGVANLLAGI